MATILQHRREERLVRERQLGLGAKRFTHIRPLSKHLAREGALVRLQNGYGKNARFGPTCIVLSSRQIHDVSELTDSEREGLPIEFHSIERLRAHDWARGPKLQVITVGVLSEADNPA